MAGYPDACPAQPAQHSGSQAGHGWSGSGWQAGRSAGGPRAGPAEQDIRSAEFFQPGLDGLMDLSCRVKTIYVDYLACLAARTRRPRRSDC
jgi:hypothetical protein